MDLDLEISYILDSNKRRFIPYVPLAIVTAKLSELCCHGDDLCFWLKKYNHSIPLLTIEPLPHCWKWWMCIVGSGFSNSPQSLTFIAQCWIRRYLLY